MATHTPITDFLGLTIGQFRQIAAGIVAVMERRNNKQDG